jgi:alpha-aminoadipate carrier protein LysW
MIPATTTQSPTQIATHSTTSTSCTCPECEGAIRFDRPPLRSQVVRCTSCGVELEVVNTAPIELALAPEVEEDWGE